MDEFTCEPTAALNGKLANEYGRNRHAIRTQEFGYEYDVDFDLDPEEGNCGGKGGAEEIRADLTKSSLDIRGGLIRSAVATEDIKY